MSTTNQSPSDEKHAAYASLHKLEKVEYYHVNNLDKVESDPFAVENVILTENSKMANIDKIDFEKTDDNLQE